MAQSNFIRFFNKRGEDNNFSSYDNDLGGKKYEGSLFFPKTSIRLTESEHIFVLQEVTVDSVEPIKRRITGNAVVIAGNPIVTIEDGNVLNEIVINDQIEIQGHAHTVIADPTESTLYLSPTPDYTVSTTNIYIYDFISYNELLTSPDIDEEHLTLEFEEETGPFFFYDVEYSENLPIITKSRTFDLTLATGATAIDATTGRIIVPATDQNINPAQVNIGFSSDEENNFEEMMYMSLMKSKTFSSDSWIYLDGEDNTYSIYIDKDSSIADYIEELQNTKKVYLIRTAGDSYHEFLLSFISLEEGVLTNDVDDIDCYILTVREHNSNMLYTLNDENLSTFSIKMTWKEELADIVLYGETEAEDERFRIVLENFGRKIDEEKTYIIRESDINEELTDYRILNKKRKELLLEGDKIYPYMGSYKALVNVLNLFGYSDVEIKEYFMNVDSTSVDYGKFTSVTIPRTQTIENLKRTWQILPSNIYKKTSLFGLYYKLNDVTGEYDEWGMPIVEEEYAFTAEEVLIKLFGLKELLKKDYLPLNARIYDITGEGIYFERYKIDNWTDDLDIRTIDLGTVPTLNIFPDTDVFIRDIRVIDDYYIREFTKQGISGFYSDDMLVHSWETTIPQRDPIWETMPPSLDDIDFNSKMAYTMPLPDDKENGAIGAPILLEVVFEISWDECKFHWDSMETEESSTEDTHGSMWTWDTISRGIYVDLRILVSYTGTKSFSYDSGRKPLTDFEYEYTDKDNQTYLRVLHPVNLPYAGTYEITSYVYDSTNGFTLQYRKKEVKTSNAAINATYQNQEIFDTFDELDITWEKSAFDWQYPVISVTKWDDMDIIWNSLTIENLEDNQPVPEKYYGDIIEINRQDKYVILEGDLTVNYLAAVGEYLFFTRLSSELEIENLEIQKTLVTVIDSETITIPTTGLEDLQLYSKVMLKKSDIEYYNASTGDFCYADVTSIGSVLTLSIQGDIETLLEEADTYLYIDSGIYSGTYALEISSIETGDNTKFYLKDPNRELYKLDGFFDSYFATFDVDYAETHIGLNSELYENSSVSWDEYAENSWISRERHSSLAPGFMITKVAAGGIININDDEDDFQFSGSSVLNDDSLGLQAAITELISSTNEEIKKYEYELFPSVANVPFDYTGATLTISESYLGSVALSGTPINLKVKPTFDISLTGTTLTITQLTSGCGYYNVPAFSLAGSTGTATVNLSLTAEGTISLDSYTASDFYTVPTYEISYPEGYEENVNDYIWTGKEWAKIDTVNDNVLSFVTPTIYLATNALIPYRWHTQQYMTTPKIYTDYYFGIKAVSKTSSVSSFDQIHFYDGVQGEWYDDLTFTSSYPMSNSVLFHIEGFDDDNVQYKYWEYNNRDFYDNDLDKMRKDYLGAFSQTFMFTDICSSSTSFDIPTNTLVMFNDDSSRVPSKTTRIWKIFDKNGKELITTQDEKLSWKFDEVGYYEVYLELYDKNDNMSSVSKKSFVNVT